VLGVSTLNAQTFADFKRTQAQTFQQYKDERDNDFNKYLKQQWKAYNVLKGKPRYEKPKPTVIPTTKPKKIKSVGPKISIKVKKIKYVKPKPIQKFIVVKKTTPVVIKKPTVKKVEPKKKEVKKPKAKNISFDFFGSTLGFDVPDKIKSAKYYPQNQKGISNFFDSAASSDYKEFIQDIVDVKKVMNLNDWGAYLLVLKISENIYPNSEDNAKLLSWFIFNKMGYAVKVGLAKKHIVLMHYSKKVIYSTPNYNFGKKKFYVVANYAKGSVGNFTHTNKIIRVQINH